MIVPPELCAAVRGTPTIGTWDVMVPFLTVDEAGFPHVCLLSRAELDADAESVYAVLASPTTIANLRRDGRATVIAVAQDAAVYCKLTAEKSIVDGGWLGVRFSVASVKRDGLNIPLRPPGYLVTTDLAGTENWAHSTDLMTRLTTVT